MIFSSTATENNDDKAPQADSGSDEVELTENLNLSTSNNEDDPPCGKSTPVAGEIRPIYSHVIIYTLLLHFKI